MATVTTDMTRPVGPGQCGPLPARTIGPAADRSPAAARPGWTVRSWPLLVLAVPAAAEVWSGWVGIAQKTGFGLVSPLPGMWNSLHLDTAVTLAVGVEAYAAYALRAWLPRNQAVSAQTRRFAKWSAIFSFTFGMAGQVAYHLMAQAGMARAPWPVTTVVSCLPVLALGIGDRAGAHAARRRRGDRRSGQPGLGHRPPCSLCPGPRRTRRDQTRGTGRRTRTSPKDGIRMPG
jgi:hypothetical protein